MKLLIQILTAVVLCIGVLHALTDAEANSLQNQCRKRCRFNRYAGCYFRHPSNCQKYIRCVRDVLTFNRFYVYTYDCPFGTFFSEMKKQCDHSYNIDCPNDPCKISNTLTYDHKVDVGISNCRSHWVCREGKSYVACCASGYKYVEGDGCVKDINCRDHCYSETKCKEPEPGPSCRSYFECSRHGTFTPSCCPLGQEYDFQRKSCKPNPSCIADCDPACPYKKVFGNDKAFLHGGTIKACPLGTVFRESVCACAMDSDYIPNSECKPKVDLSFSGANILSPHISYYGLADTLGVGHFENNSHIEIPFYDHGSDLDKVLIDFKFKANEQAQNAAPFQIMLSNCKTVENTKQPTPSLQIVLSRLNHVLLFSGLTTTDISGVFELPYEANQWNQIKLEFDGNILKAKVVPEIVNPMKQYNGEISLRGRLRPSVSSLSIAGCAGLIDKRGKYLNTFFHGEMDDIKVYTGCMPRNTVK